jgi:hypothetical protein
MFRPPPINETERRIWWTCSCSTPTSGRCTGSPSGTPSGCSSARSPRSTKPTPAGPSAADRRPARPVRRHPLAVPSHPGLVPARRARPRPAALRLLRRSRHHHRSRAPTFARRAEHLDQHRRRLRRLQPAEGRPDAVRSAHAPTGDAGRTGVGRAVLPLIECRASGCTPRRPAPMRAEVTAACPALDRVEQVRILRPQQRRSAQPSRARQHRVR